MRGVPSIADLRFALEEARRRLREAEAKPPERLPITTARNAVRNREASERYSNRITSALTAVRTIEKQLERELVIERIANHPNVVSVRWTYGWAVTRVNSLASSLGRRATRLDLLLVDGSKHEVELCFDFGAAELELIVRALDDEGIKV